MSEFPAACTDLKNHCEPDDILEMYGEAAEPIDPAAYACGIVDTGIGLYQEAGAEDGTRVLLFSPAVRGFQKTVNDQDGVRFAHPEKLYVVGAFEREEPSYVIHAAMIAHSAALRKEIAEKYTLYETGHNVFKSLPASFAIGVPRGQTGEFPTLIHTANEKVHIHCFIGGQAGHKFQEVFADEEAHFGGKFSPRFPVTTAPITRQESFSCMMLAFNEMLRGMMKGHAALDDEMAKLPYWEQVERRAGVRMEKLLTKSSDYFTGQIKYFGDALLHPSGKTSDEWIELASRCFAIGEILVEPSKVIGVGAKNLWEGFHPNSPHPGHLPNELSKRYILPLHRNRSSLLNPLDPVAGAKLFPYELYYSKLSTGKIETSDPMEGGQGGQPTLAATIAPLGRIKLRRGKYIVTFQADGLWSIRSEKSTYVGYNPVFDMPGDPRPAASIGMCLAEGKIIQFSHSHNRNHGVVRDFADVQERLSSLLATDIGQLITAHAPDRVATPHYIDSAQRPHDSFFSEKGFWRTTVPVLHP